MPTADRVELAEIGSTILQKAGELSGAVHSVVVREKLRALVAEMNSYYSNLIEGHKTLPVDIERALKQDYSIDAKTRDMQLLSRAHIQVQGLLERRLAEEAVNVCSAEFVSWLHGEFYRRLPESMACVETSTGKRTMIEPGAFRDFMVDVGRHTPPSHESIPAFLGRWGDAYDRERIRGVDRLIAVGAAHHRLTWIHPFGDGNGRVARLLSHAMLLNYGVAGTGLWTLSRGLARQRRRYYELLEEADQQRRDDYDGRGNLSDKGLASFCRFFLETMLDQVQFMTELLSLPTLRARIERYFAVDAVQIPRYRDELMRVVRVLIDEGEIPRGRVAELTGRGATVSAEIIKVGLRESLMESPSAKGPLRIAFPSKVLSVYFPQLFLDLPV